MIYIVAVPIYIPNNNATGFPFLNILANTSYFLYVLYPSLRFSRLHSDVTCGDTTMEIMLFFSPLLALGSHHCTMEGVVPIGGRGAGSLLSPSPESGVDPPLWSLTFIQMARTLLQKNTKSATHGFF